MEILTTMPLLNFNIFSNEIHKSQNKTWILQAKNHQGLDTECQKKKKNQSISNYERLITSLLLSHEEGECLVL